MQWIAFCSTVAMDSDLLVVIILLLINLLTTQLLSDCDDD